MTMAGYRTMMRFLLSVGIIFQVCDSDVKCRNDNGDEVDWYILYKFPKKIAPLSYMYMDETTNGWKYSKRQINSKSGILANTLKPLLDFYDKKTEGFGYMLYNDKPSTKKTAPASFGHSKGVVMLDKQTGVWLSHSTPNFPTYRRKKFWPNSGNVNAQTFLCVTYPYSEFKEIGVQLKYIHAYSYDYDIPKTFHKELRCVAQRDCYPKREPWFRVMTLTSMKGRNFTSFAKYKRFGDDLYSGLIVGSLKQNLCVKSWRRNGGPLPAEDNTPYHVYDVKGVKMKSIYVKETEDHSKWCVTLNSNWTCIADTNREKSQMKRGGGAICIDDVAVWRAFYTMIPRNESCKYATQAPPHREL